MGTHACGESARRALANGNQKNSHTTLQFYHPSHAQGDLLPAALVCAQQVDQRLLHQPRLPRPGLGHDGEEPPAIQNACFVKTARPRMVETIGDSLLSHPSHFVNVCPLTDGYLLTWTGRQASMGRVYSIERHHPNSDTINPEGGAYRLISREGRRRDTPHR